MEADRGIGGVATKLPFVELKVEVDAVSLGLLLLEPSETWEDWSLAKLALDRRRKSFKNGMVETERGEASAPGRRNERPEASGEGAAVER